MKVSIKTITNVIHILIRFVLSAPSFLNHFGLKDTKWFIGKRKINTA